MKRPILTAIIALAVVILGLTVIGSLMPGQTRIEQSVVMQGTPERIWPLFADLKGWPSWYWAEDGTHMTRSELLNRPMVALGTIRRAEESTGGFWEEKVSAFEVNKRLELVGERTPGRTNWRQEITLEAVDAQQTKVTWKVEYDVSGPILKLLNRSRAEDQFVALIQGSFAGIETRVPTAEEWGPATMDPAPGAGGGTVQAPAPVAKDGAAKDGAVSSEGQATEAK